MGGSRLLPVSQETESDDVEGSFARRALALGMYPPFEIGTVAMPTMAKSGIPDWKFRRRSFDLVRFGKRPQTPQLLTLGGQQG